MSTPEHEQQEQRSSVKVTRNAKGDAQFEVKVRVGDSEADVDEARRIAVAQYQALSRDLGAQAA